MSLDHDTPAPSVLSGSPTLSGSLGRIGAMVRRYVYLLRGSIPRILELAYWPTIQMVIWGFVTQFFMGHSSWVAQAAGVLIGAVLLWDVLFRGQIGFSICFLEEMWSRNLGHLFVSPLRPWELVASLMVMSLIRTLIGLLPAWLLAIVFYGFSMFELGPPLVAFFSCLMLMSWGLGMLVVGLVLRAGLGAESLAWVGIFLLAPVSAIYYPVSTLPEWLQVVAWATPAAYVFEGMRELMFENIFRWDLLAGAMAANAVFLAVGGVVFAWSFADARADGRLLQIGE